MVLRWHRQQQQQQQPQQRHPLRQRWLHATDVADPTKLCWEKLADWKTKQANAL